MQFDSCLLRDLSSLNIDAIPLKPFCLSSRTQTLHWKSGCCRLCLGFRPQLGRIRHWFWLMFRDWTFSSRCRPFRNVHRFTCTLLFEMLAAQSIACACKSSQKSKSRDCKELQAVWCSLWPFYKWLMMYECLHVLVVGTNREGTQRIGQLFALLSDTAAVRNRQHEHRLATILACTPLPE